MGDKNVKKKIIIISIGLILLNPVNIFAKSNDDGLYKSSYSQNYIKYDKDPINKPSIGTNLYIISSDEILQLYNGTRKRADTVLGYNCKYYFAYAIENKKNKFLEFKYNNINYYIPLIESTRVSNVSDIRSL